MNSKSINWRIYERDHLYPQGISAYLDLVKLSPKNYPYIANYYEVMTYYRDYFWWSRDAEALEKTFRFWVKQWLRSNTKKKEIYSLYQKSHIDTKKILLPLKNINPAKVSNERLYDLYRTAQKVFLDSISYSEYTTDMFDDFFGKILNEQIFRLSKSLTAIELSQLGQPAYISQGQFYRRQILKLSFKKKIAENELEKIARIFGWVMMGWDGSRELTVKQIKNDLAKVKKEKANSRRQELRQIDGFVRIILEKRKRILKKYNLPSKQLNPYFSLLDTFTKFHDWRKETQMRANQIIFPALREMVRRFKIGYQDLVFYQNSEIKLLCLKQKKVSQTKINSRKAGLTWVIKQGKIQEFTGPGAKKVLDKLVLNVVKVNKTSMVNGLPASPGKVVGRAFVVRDAKEAVRIIKPGGILVASMTMPNYLPAMKKAGAVVTDDGGIICHAAIVSRELGIPCIVGTKVATQIFKTGDKLEVDANKGVVRKI